MKGVQQMLDTRDTVEQLPSSKQRWNKTHKCTFKQETLAMIIVTT